MKYRIAAIALTIGAAACAGSGSPGSPGPGSALAYTMPAVNPLVYTSADTVAIDMDISGTFVQVSVESNASLETRFSQAGSALQAVIRYTGLSGSFNNTMGPPMPLSNSDIPGPATVTVHRNGAIDVVELPESSEAFRQILGSETAYSQMFVRLPGRAAQPGEMWTDTITTTEDAGQMTTEMTRIVTSTLVGDTTVSGRRLQLISSDIRGTTRISGMNQGMEIRQYLNGAFTATTLWDPARNAVVERVENGSAEGTMELPGMGMTGMPVRMSSKSVLRLQSN